MMVDEPWILLDGELQKSSRPGVAATSRGLMYGDGCFETFRSYRGRFLKLDLHLNRLEEGLNYLGIRYPSGLKMENLLADLKKLLKKNKLSEEDAVIRLQVWREGNRGYRVEMPAFGHYSAAATTVKKASKSTRLATVSIKRIPSSALPSQYKLSNGINFIVAAQQAKKQSADDALMETVDGNISETTIANIFWMKNEAVFTPSEKCDILPGVTRNIVLEILRNEFQFEVYEGYYKPEQIKNADAVWICNSVKEIMPVSSIDEARFETETAFFEDLMNSFESYLHANLSNG